MKKTVLMLLGVLAPLGIWAQTPVNIRFVSMNEFLPYVLPFYVVTMLAMGLLIHKLMRPAFSNKWLYICTLVGIIGAGVLTYKFKEFRDTKLLDKSYELMLQDEQLKMRLEKEGQNEIIGNFWRIAIPNFIFLFLGIAIDFRNKKSPEELNGPTGDL